MVDWVAAAAKARAGVEKAGAPVAITGPSTGAGVYDPDTDTYTPTPGGVRTAHAVLSPQEITNDEGRRVTATIATVTAVIATDDTLTMADGTSYRVLRSLTFAPGGVPLLWGAVLET